MAKLKLPNLSVRATLWMGLIFVNALVISLAGLWLLQSRHGYEERTRVLTQNIVMALDQNVSRSVSAIDLGIRAVVDELERQLAAGGIDEKAMTAFLTRYESRLAAVSAQSKIYCHKIQPSGTQLCWHLTTQNRHNHGDTQDTATR